MLRLVLIIAWIAALGFFVWEFTNANSMPERFSKLNPSTIRWVDVAFAATILATLYYLIADK